VEFDIYLAIAGLIVGLVVGLTGMGGGALMTPILVLVFGVQPLAAVSSDLVASLIMKPVGGAVHLRHGTVQKGLVTWLVVGSVPAGFCGVLVLNALGDGQQLQDRIELGLGIALLVASAAMVIKSGIHMVGHARALRSGTIGSPERRARYTGPLTVRPLPTVLIGAIGGLIVGMTSVGSGSLIIIMLIALYPRLRANDLVGTDLVQAVPLVASASLGHLIFGDFQLGLTTSLLVGAIPGVYFGAKASARAPGGLVRRALTFVLVASGLKLVGMDTVTLGIVLLAAGILGPLAWALFRRSQGLPLVHSPKLRSRVGGRVAVGSGGAGQDAGEPDSALDTRLDTDPL